MEEENSVFGVDAEDINEFDTEEKFSIYHKDKETAENNIRKSAKDLTDFFDTLLQDEPEPSKEEIERGIAGILEKTHPEEAESEPTKTAKSKKVTFRVLFIAALLSALSFTCIFAVGSRHNISIENGFVTFAKDAVKIVFFDEDKEEYIDVKTLIEDLNSNGFENVLLPQELYNNYKSSVPVYSKVLEDTSTNKRVMFELSNDSISYFFEIAKVGSDRLKGNYFADLNNAETIVVDDVSMYVFEFKNGLSYIRFINDGYDYLIQSEVSLAEMMNTAQTIIKTEE